MSHGLKLSRGLIASALVWLAMMLCSFVMYEPAPADVLLFGAILALPILGQTRPMPVTTIVTTLFVINIALGLMIAEATTDPIGVIRFHLITLYLVLAGYVVAGWVVMAPERRFEILVNGYITGSVIASILAVIGFFDIVPGSAALFTEFGRAKGPFKDPNVLGAALVPTLLVLVWRVMTASPGAMLRNGIWLSICGVALLLTFSRGAWIAFAIPMLFMAVFLVAGATTGRKIGRIAVATVAMAVIVPIGILSVLSADSVRDLAAERLSLEQSYDVGPEGRFGGQLKAVDIILEQPFGIGALEFSRTRHIEEPHNVYLSQFLNSGWIGGFAYIAAVGITLIAGIWYALTPGRVQVPLIIATACVIALIIEGFVIDTDHWRHFYLLIGCCAALVDVRFAERPAAMPAAVAGAGPTRSVGDGSNRRGRDPSERQRPARDALKRRIAGLLADGPPVVEREARALYKPRKRPEVAAARSRYAALIDGTPPVVAAERRPFVQPNHNAAPRQSLDIAAGSNERRAPASAHHGAERRSSRIAAHANHPSTPANSRDLATRINRASPLEQVPMTRRQLLSTSARRAEIGHAMLKARLDGFGDVGALNSSRQLRARLAR
ncbi:MAG: O-antigen ligase family protein [Hyphomicrobiaceae bacterium]